jgi:hypothetical protein
VQSLEKQSLQAKQPLEERHSTWVGNRQYFKQKQTGHTDTNFLKTARGRGQAVVLGADHPGQPPEEPTTDFATPTIERPAPRAGTFSILPPELQLQVWDATRVIDKSAL